MRSLTRLLTAAVLTSSAAVAMAAAYIETEFSTEYRKAYAEYQRLLSSPAYTAAVAKYQSRLGGK